MHILMVLFHSIGRPGHLGPYAQDGHLTPQKWNEKASSDRPWMLSRTSDHFSPRDKMSSTSDSSTNQIVFHGVPSNEQCAPKMEWKSTFRPLAPMQWNWPRDRKLTQSCWCSIWYLGLRPDVCKNLLHVHTTLVVTHLWIEKCKKNKETDF